MCSNQRFFYFYFADSYTYAAGQKVVFSDSVSGGTLPYTYNWSGTVSGTHSSVSKVFSSPGNYEAIVTVRDSLNQRATDSCSIIVKVPPNLKITNFTSLSAEVGKITSFSYTVTNNGGSTAEGGSIPIYIDGVLFYKPELQNIGVGESKTYSFN